MEETGGIYTLSCAGSALRQGEIVSNLVQARLALSSLASQSSPVVELVTHPLAIVMTQDCDLDWDFKARQEGGSENKLIPSILFCEVISAEGLKGRVPPGSAIWGRIKQNKDERYHFLQKIQPGDDAVGDGLPELGIDFKRYFTIPADEVYYLIGAGTQRRCQIRSPYLEHLSTRFGYYQFRVALPAEHLSE